MIARREEYLPKRGKYHEIVVRMLAEGMKDYPPEPEPQSTPEVSEYDLLETDDQKTLYLAQKRINEGKLTPQTFFDYLQNTFGTQSVHELTVKEHVRVRNYLRKLGKT